MSALGEQKALLHIRDATDEDLPQASAMSTANFEFIPSERAMGNVNTPEGHRNWQKRHREAWDIYKATTGHDPGICCVRTDPNTKEQSVAAFAEWFIDTTIRRSDHLTGDIYLLSAPWVPDIAPERAIVDKWEGPILEKRLLWTRGRAVGVLMYMCTEIRWQRRGAATMCVRWGLERCAELGIPALLEASDQGRPVYARLGFEVVDEVSVDTGNGTKAVFPVMMWWPPGTKEEDKKPLES